MDDIWDAVQMGRQKTSTQFHGFCRDVVEMYGATYLNVGPAAVQLGSVHYRRNRTVYRRNNAALQVCYRIYKDDSFHPGSESFLIHRDSEPCSPIDIT